MVTPNPIVEEVTINDWPDHFLVPYVIPAAERTAITIVWTTDSPNYISQGAVVSVVQQPILTYVNSIPCGVTPLSVYELEAIFLDAPTRFCRARRWCRCVINVSIDGVGVLPEPGTGVIPGDINGYFMLDAGDLTILEGGQGDDAPWYDAAGRRLAAIVIHGLEHQPIITAEQNLYGGFIVNPADDQNVEPPEPLYVSIVGRPAL